MALSTQTQRTLLLGFVACLAFCGLIGIYFLIVGQFGTFEVRILGTTASIGGASILALAAAVAWETRRWPPLGLLGMIAPALALVLVLTEIWDIAPRTSFDRYERLVGSACVLAVALPHICLLALARLHRAYEWTRFATTASVVTLASLIMFVIWNEPRDDAWPRIIGIFAILDACGSIAVPILHRISNIRAAPQIVTIDARRITIICPRCEKMQSVAAGVSRCDCGLRFHIEIEEEHCPKCGYSLYQLTGNICPECGTPV